MSVLDSVHHLVHIGFDGNEQLDFENRLKEYIESISNSTKTGVNHAIVFVDEPIPTQKEIEYNAFINFAERIVTVIEAFHIESMGFNSITPEIYLERKGYDAGFIADVIEFLGQSTISYIRKRPVYNSTTTKEQDEEFIQYNSVYRDIYETKLIKLVKALWRKYKNKILAENNRYFSNDLATKIPSINSRRLRIYQTIRELCPDLPIVSGYMLDGDLNKLNRGKRACNLDLEKHEKGHMQDQFLRLGGMINSGIISRRLLNIKDELNKEGLTKNTKHFVLGEYTGRCVNAYSSLISMAIGITPVVLNEFSLLKE